MTTTDDASQRAVPLTVASLTVFRDDERGDQRTVVHDLSFELGAGQALAIAGPGGAGKTSLLLSLVGAVPFEGTIVVGELALERKSLSRVRAGVGFVFAEPADQLFSKTVFDEVAFGLVQRGKTENEIRARVERVLARVGLSGFEARRPTQLSQGEQKRLAIATALVLDPALMVLDEPTASLDPLARRALIRTLADIESTLVFATHDLDAIVDLNARVLLLCAGRAIADGPARHLLADQALLARAGLALPLGLSPRPREP